MAKNKALIGSEQIVLIEKKIENNLIGRTFRDAPEIDGQVIIQTQDSESLDDSLLGELVKVKIINASTYDLIGEIVQTDSLA